MKVSVRPNRNKKGECTIHSGKLGKVSFYSDRVTIQCDSVTVRKAGRTLAMIHGKKEIHASLNGTIVPFIEPSPDSKIIKYNPHVGDEGFSIDGTPYEGGGIVTFIGWVPYLVG